MLPSSQPDSGKRLMAWISWSGRSGGGFNGKGRSRRGWLPATLCPGHRPFRCRRIAQGDGGLDGAGFAVDLEAQPFPGVLLRFRGRLKLGLHDDGGTAGGGYQHVGMAARVVGEGLGVLGPHGASGHHAPQQVAEGIVDAGFGLFGGGHSPPIKGKGVTD